MVGAVELPLLWEWDTRQARSENTPLAFQRQSTWNFRCNIPADPSQGPRIYHQGILQLLRDGE